MKVEASWDSTVHECPQLSRVTPAEQRVYLTVKAVVQLSHPANMQLVLRKRICVNVVGRQVGERPARRISVRLYFQWQRKEENHSWSRLARKIGLLNYFLVELFVILILRRLTFLLSLYLLYFPHYRAHFNAFNLLKK